ncbi:MAG: fibronectin type III domain-containing protein [Cyanobium sp.]
MSLFGYTSAPTLTGSAQLLMASDPILSVSRGADVAIKYDACDSDSDAIISFYYDTDGVNANGIFIATGIQEKDGVGTFTWDTKDVQTGTYYVYAVIDDGGNAPTYSYLPDPIRILDPEVLPQVQGVTGKWSGDNSVELNWEAIPDIGVVYYVVSYTHIASGDRNEEEESGSFEITDDTRLRLTGLKSGDYYRFIVQAVNIAGEEGLPSDPIAVLVGDRYTAPLEIDEWEFLAHASDMYISDLSLNQDQQAKLLRGPEGAVIKDGKFIWDVPVEIGRGMYEVSIRISDVFGNEATLDRRLLVSDRISEPKPSPTYSYTTSANAIDEGSSLAIGVFTTNVTPASPLYWRFGGTGITASDFSDGLLEGSTVIGIDGRSAFSKAIAADAANDPDETLELRFYNDAARTQQVGSTVSVLLRQTIIGLITDASDNLTGTNAAETLIGVPSGSTLRGRGSLDRLTGGGGDDLFALGDATGRFYDDGTPGLGSADLALVRDFNAGDRIQLHGLATDYRLISGRYAGVAGLRIDALSPTPEAIGFVQGATLASLNLTNASQFLFV